MKCPECKVKVNGRELFGHMSKTHHWLTGRYWFFVGDNGASTTSYFCRVCGKVSGSAVRVHRTCSNSCWAKFRKGEISGDHQSILAMEYKTRDLFYTARSRVLGDNRVYVPRNAKPKSTPSPGNLGESEKTKPVFSPSIIPVPQSEPMVVARALIDLIHQDHEKITVFEQQLKERDTKIAELTELLSFQDKEISEYRGSSIRMSKQIIELTEPVVKRG
jgi:hypothetical protein